MRITTTLTDADGTTEVAIEHDGIPPGVSAENNEIGTGCPWRSSQRWWSLDHSEVGRSSTNYP
jgi:hypothetical protein